jgi:hypothetical protein
VSSGIQVTKMVAAMNGHSICSSFPKWGFGNAIAGEPSGRRNLPQETRRAFAAANGQIPFRGGAASDLAVSSTIWESTKHGCRSDVPLPLFARHALNQIMQTITITRIFPHSEATLVHQSGARLTEATKGVEIILHTREGEDTPCCAELVSGNHYAEIGLWFEGKELSDYDGVFTLPREVGEILKDAGFVVPEEFFA